ncbi:hypothetical protein LOC67_11350 [Stieleria sp. JC731]|uniref:hypothetical protein n=1 Tax=Pirellulaceae TaxID=2691357 RepID=UPI001E2AFF67|nr:hypothetical protein [Stieleria sp. JC731]MCC9601141.1 hypothetical protein [Stieleria sp. JC731]
MKNSQPVQNAAAQQKNAQRKNPPIRRPLNVERLEMRTMLAAAIFSGIDDAIELPPRRVLLEAGDDGGAAFFSQLLTPQQKASDRTPAHSPGDEIAFTLDGKPINVFVLRDFDPTVLESFDRPAPSDALDPDGQLPPEVDRVFPERVAASFERAVEELGRRFPGPRRQIAVSPVLVKFESKDADFETLFDSPSEILQATGSAQIDVDILEQSINSIAEEPSSLPPEFGSDDGIQQEFPISKRPKPKRPVVDFEDEEGGLIELRKLDSAEALFDLPEARTTNNVWHIDLQTANATIQPATNPSSIGQPVTGKSAGPPPTSAPAITSPSVSRDSVSASVDDDGGLIQITGSSLPHTFAASGKTGLRVQLAPNVGRIRNFQLADAPGLDSDLENEPGSDLVARWDGPSDDGSDDSESDRDKRASKRSGITLSGILVAGGLLLTTASQNQADAAVEQ